MLQRHCHFMVNHKNVYLLDQVQHSEKHTHAKRVYLLRKEKKINLLKLAEALRMCLSNHTTFAKATHVEKCI